MPAKIRLQRYGKKGQPYYHIVVADGRAPRDGRYIERIGSYNPNTNPAFIDINTEKALSWLQKGAQPTDTTRAILSYTGVLYKKHLDVGVKKGALTQEQADEKFQGWLEEKRNKVQAKRDRLAGKKESDIKARLEAESKVKEAKAKAVLAKTSPIAEEAVAAKSEDQSETAVAEAEEPVQPQQAQAEESTTAEAAVAEAAEVIQPEEAPPAAASTSAEAAIQPEQEGPPAKKDSAPEAGTEEEAAPEEGTKKQE